MVKGLFCYDGPVYVDRQGNVYDVALNNEALAMYFSVVDSLDILIRIRSVDDVRKKSMSSISLENVRVVSLPDLLSVKGLLFERNRTRKIIEEHVQQADVIFARLPSFAGDYAIRLARKYDKPYIVELISCPWGTLWNHSMGGKMLAPFRYVATRNSMKASPYAVYVTSEFLQNRYPSRGRSIGCSDVVLAGVDERVLAWRLSRIDGWNAKNRVVLGTTGAVDVRYKGQEYIIRAIAQLNKQGCDFEYRIVGGGDNSYLRSVAEKYGVTDRVKFLGTLPHAKIFAYLSELDIYVQPSKTEGLPRALIEAMSCGLPALGTKTGGIPELLSSDCVFSPRFDIDEICSMLLSFDREKMKLQASRNFAEAKKYEKHLLEARRQAFFKEFVENVRK